MGSFFFITNIVVIILFIIFAPQYYTKIITRKGMEDSEKEMTFLDHLEELRWHIIRAAVAVLLVSVVAFVWKDIVFNILFLTFPLVVDLQFIVHYRFIVIHYSLHSWNAETHSNPYGRHTRRNGR